MLKKLFQKQDHHDDNFNVSRIPEKRRRGRPKAVARGERKNQKISRNINGTHAEPSQNVIDHNDLAYLDDSLSNMSIENTANIEKRENKVKEAGMSPIEDILQFKEKKQKLSHTGSNECSQIHEDDFKDDLDSNFDSPYHGEDKFCLDILEDEVHPNQEFPKITDNVTVNKKPFAILDKNFTFGTEPSPNLQKKNTFDDLSSSDVFDFDMESSERKDKLFANDKPAEVDSLNQEFEDYRGPLLDTLLDPNDDFKNPEKDMNIEEGLYTQMGQQVEQDKCIESGIGSLQDKDFMDSPIKEFVNQEVECEEPILTQNIKGDKQGIEQLTKDRTGNLNTQEGTLLANQFAGLGNEPVEQLIEEHKKEGYFREFESQENIKENLAELTLEQLFEEMSENKDFLLRKNEKREEESMFREEEDKKIEHRVNEEIKQKPKNQGLAPKKVSKLTLQRKTGSSQKERVTRLKGIDNKEKKKQVERQRKRELETTKKAIQSGTTLREIEKVNRDNRTKTEDEEKNGRKKSQGLDDDFDELFQEKIKKKKKKEKQEGEEEAEVEAEGEKEDSMDVEGTGSKYTVSESDNKDSEVAHQKKGVTSTKELERPDNALFSDEFPRRSRREKREPPKSYEKKLFGNVFRDDFGFTFVEFKNYKVQKIKIIISFRALLMMNIHAHLSTLEVIGILGGTVVSEDEIIIQEALPCKNISESSNTHSVEMDPASQFSLLLHMEVESQERLEKMGYKTLGWYHSHPTFKSIPSQIDQETHITHQIHYKDHHYIGVIIGPYSTERAASKTMKGEVFVFHVSGNQTYKLNFSVQPSQSLPYHDMEEIEKVISDYRKTNKAVKFKDKWKKGTSYQTKLLSCVETLLEENLASLKANSQGGLERLGLPNNSNTSVLQKLVANEESKKKDISLDSKLPIQHFLNSLERWLQ